MLRMQKLPKLTQRAGCLIMSPKQTRLPLNSPRRAHYCGCGSRPFQPPRQLTRFRRRLPCSATHAMEEAPLLLPISTTPTPSSSSSSYSPSTQSIVLRVVAVLAVACASLFAQHEAAKGFAVDVARGAKGGGGAAASRRFDLFFVSNGRAERVLLRASRGVERALFPDASFPRRHVRRVTVRVAARNLTAEAEVHAPAPGEYVISLSPALVMAPGGGADAVARAVRRAVARMWLWDGRGAAPERVTESMVEYLASVADGAGVAATPLSEAEGECMSARFLRHLERQRAGFVARLNRAMRDRWSDAAVDAALGAPARHACAAYRAAAAHDDSTSDASRGSSVAM
ncbi:hypothetical protein BS78_09G249800 [Paspalum vaginatum]|nr:hypothetical protein BS78_09G249800 [Paspalum vaginatum]